MKFSFLAQDEDQFTKEIALESRDQLQSFYSSSKLSETSNDKTTQSIVLKPKRQKDKTTKTIGSFKEFNKLLQEEMNENRNKTDVNFSSKIKQNQAPLLEEEEEENLNEDEND